MIAVASRTFCIFCLAVSLQSAKWSQRRSLPSTTPPPLRRSTHCPRTTRCTRPRPPRARRVVSPLPEVHTPDHAWYRRAQRSPLLPSQHLMACHRAPPIRQAGRCRRWRGSFPYRRHSRRSSIQRRAWHMRHTPRPGTWHMPHRRNTTCATRATTTSRASPNICTR